MRVVDVVLHDDHRMFSAALASSLDGAAHHVVGVVARADDVAARMRETQADVCVLGSAVRGRFEAGPAAAVKSESPGARVLVLTAGDDPALWAAYDDGLVDAVVSKSHGLDTIRTAIDRVALGERFALAAARPRMPTHAAPTNLTERESEILHLLARGADTHQIMEALEISRNTVRTHVQHLLDKLHAHTRAQAVQIALATRLLHLESDLVRV